MLILLSPRSATFNDNPSTPIAIENKKTEHFGGKKTVFIVENAPKPGTVLRIVGTPQFDPVCPVLVYWADL
jgi:hypothetical protein